MLTSLLVKMQLLMAQADEDQPPDKDIEDLRDVTDNIGDIDSDFLGSFADPINNLTGFLRTWTFVIGLVLFFWNLIKFAVSGSNKKRQDDAKSAMALSMLVVLVAVLFPSIWGLMVDFIDSIKNG